MDIEKYDPKFPLAYLIIVSDSLKQYKNFHNPLDIPKIFGVDCVTDITDAPEFESLRSIGPLPKDFNERLFLFKESEKRRGMIEIAFHRAKFIHLRITMHFSGWFPRIDALKFFKNELHPTITGIMGSTGYITYEPYPAFNWDSYHKFYVVRVGFNKEHGYVSTYLNHMDYIEYF
jgi:hypothetical protein